MATMNFAPRTQTELALGTWGALQGSGAGREIALGGIIHDVLSKYKRSERGRRGDGVRQCLCHRDYAIAIVLLAATDVTMIPG